jgi:hypothetical protein
MGVTIATRLPLIIIEAFLEWLWAQGIAAGGNGMAREF